jgi:hypothetical protein
MRDHVRFQSGEFTPPGAEPGQINTDRYGYLLATWLAARLKERGFDVGVPTPEDWGWLLGIANDGQTVIVGCGNVEGSSTEWLIWTQVDTPGVLSRLFKRANPTPNALYGIVAAIHGALGANESVNAVEWFRVGSRGDELDHAPTPI